MKTLFSILILLVGFSTVALAQRKDRYMERPGETVSNLNLVKVEEVTRTMGGKLHLNEAQYIQIRAVNKIKLTRAEEIEWEYADNPSLRNAKLAELEAQYELECSRILTPSQLSVLREDQKHDSIPTPASTEGGLG